MAKKSDNKITIRAFVLGVIFCAVFAALTVFFSGRKNLYTTSTQIPVLPYVLLFLSVLLINPICKLIRVIRPFSAAEILIIFVMGMVSSGISTFGLSSQLIPIAGGLFNDDWYSEQSKWNQHIAPYVDDSFFVSEDGIQEAAAKYRQAVNQAAGSRSVYEAAILMSKAEEDLAVSQSALVESQKSSDDNMSITRAQTAVGVAQGTLKEAKEEWAVAQPEDGTAVSDVLETYPALLSDFDALAATAKEELAVLEAKAFAKVEVFRRGLPRELRAFPGIFPTDKDNLATYKARFTRLVHGRKSMKALSSVQRKLEANDHEIAELLTAAAAALASVSDDTELQAKKQKLDADLEGVRGKIVSVSAQLDEKNSLRRMATHDEKNKLEKEIAKLDAEKKKIDDEQVILLSELERTNGELDMTARIQGAIADIETLKVEINNLENDAALDKLAAIIGGYRMFDASLSRYLVSDIPWEDWARPLSRWILLIGLTYMVLMSFNVLIFRQWAEHEKLTYPLAALPEQLAGVGDDGEYHIPEVFKSGLFWIGASIAGGFLGFNLLCATELIPGLRPMNLEVSWAPYITKTNLQGLLPSVRSEIFFTMIGLSFLIPKKISFSLWFFYVLYMAQQLIMVWSGYGVNEESFPSDPWFTMNFRTAEGGGALLVFGLVVLWKCRKYLVCCIDQSAVKALEPSERKELRISSFIFMISSVLVVLVLWKGLGASLPYSIFFFIVALLITVALIRAVAEGGILGFQAWCNPFQFIRTAFGMKTAWAAPKFFTPLLLYYAVLFYDIKTFIAPAMANALKIRSDLKMKRWKFHLAIFLCIATALSVAIGAELMLSYSKGANEMNTWFHTSFPKDECYGRIVATSIAPPAASAFDTGWMMFGAVFMAVLLFLRRMIFWLPHPIGMVMLVSPLMQAYWFSIFVGWLSKSLVSKYGSKDLYAKIRCLFIGLIVGELVLVALAMLCSVLFDVKFTSMGIDLNRKIM